MILARRETLRAFFLAQKRQMRLAISDGALVWSARKNSADSETYHIGEEEKNNLKSRVIGGNHTLGNSALVLEYKAPVEINLVGPSPHLIVQHSDGKKAL